MGYNHIILLLIFTIFPINVACSQDVPPTQSDIESAVTRYLQKEVPVSWVGNLMGGKNAKIISIEIDRRGLYNKDSKYWPFKLKVKGACEVNDPFNKGKNISFDNVGDFVLYRDDYGDWQAMLKGGMLQ